jgi:lysophospholipase L1-like esterase
MASQPDASEQGALRDGAPDLSLHPRFERYVALGDSFTEGLCDPALSGEHPWRGWADRVAEVLAARADAAGEPFEYANLAIRGRLLAEIGQEQVPQALTMRPDLVSIVGGANDSLRVGADMDAVAANLERLVEQLRASRATVLMSTAVDPRHSPLVRMARGNAAVLTAHVWSIARRHGALVLDLWGMKSLLDRRLWAEDRIHLTSEGHRRVALQALEVLGVEHGGDWATPLPSLPVRSRQEAWREDAEWVRSHVVPWVGRRLRGRSSGDGLPAKRPALALVLPPPTVEDDLTPDQDRFRS